MLLDPTPMGIKSELILASKARVAPRNISIPRLKLVAAQTLAKQTTIADLIVSKGPVTSYQIEIHFIIIIAECLYRIKTSVIYKIFVHKNTMQELLSMFVL